MAPARGFFRGFLLFCAAWVVPFVMLRPVVSLDVPSRTFRIVTSALGAYLLVTVVLARPRTLASYLAAASLAFAFLGFGFIWWIAATEPPGGHPSASGLVWVFFSCAFVGVVFPAMLVAVGVAVWRGERVLVTTLAGAALSVALLGMLSPLDLLAQWANCHLYPENSRWANSHCSRYRFERPRREGRM